MINAVLYDIALTTYIVAMVAALGHLLGRREGLWRLARVFTQAGWLCHWAHSRAISPAKLAEGTSRRTAIAKSQ